MTSRSGPGWIGVMLGAAVGFLTGIVLIVALGGVVHDHTRTITRQAKAPRSAATNSVTVPDLVRSGLDAAEQQLADLGLQAQVNGGGTFGVIDPSNWEVVAQNPHPKARVDPASIVELDIERR